MLVRAQVAKLTKAYISHRRYFGPVSSAVNLHSLINVLLIMWSNPSPGEHDI